MPAAAPARKAVSRSGAVPRQADPAPGAPSRAPATVQRLPGAVGRTAGAVRHIPDSGLVVRMTRGRAWIAILGIMLVGIVAINVITLSFTASTGKMEQRAVALEQQNTALEAGLARQLSNDRVEAAALGLGMVRPGADEYSYRSAAATAAGQAAERATAAVAAEPILEPPPPPAEPEPVG